MMMLLLLILLLQARLSRLVIVAAALVLIAGVSLFVYFYRRYKRVEKEPEEDWDLSRRSLFVNAPAATEKAGEANVSPAEASAAVSETTPAPARGTRELATEMETAQPTSTTAPQLEAEAKPLQEPISVAPQVQASSEARQTELLASPSPQEPIITTTEEAETPAFDEEVWAGLEITEDQPAARTPLPATAEPPRVARVEERSHREAFEPPRLEQSVSDSSHGSLDRGTELLGSASGLPAGPPPAARPETRALGAESVALSSASSVEPAIAASHGQRIRTKPPGSVLGLPNEFSHDPLILGQPARPATDIGIGALVNYGKDVGPKGGRAGTVVLLVVLVLFGGAVAAYFFVPSVHTRVTDFVARVRGADTQASLQAAKPKAQVIPSYRPEVNKNMVTARGAVDNISDQPLENLSIEVSLQRGADAPPEIRIIAITPSPLPPGARGTFEFEYDGKRDTGFASYKITKLLSNGTEVKFRAPPK